MSSNRLSPRRDSDATEGRALRAIHGRMHDMAMFMVPWCFHGSWHGLVHVLGRACGRTEGPVDLSSLGVAKSGLASHAKGRVKLDRGDGSGTNSRRG